MAKPRVFISSTFYDLRHVRADLERFIKDMGYEPVLSESPHSKLWGISRFSDMRSHWELHT
jgi:hypothetical protein